MPDEQRFNERVITYGTTLYDKYRRELKSNIIFGAVATVLLFIVAAITFVNIFVLQNVIVEGSSMFPTLYSGDVVVLNTRREPDYGDIIVISGEKGENGYWLIKRAIAFSGDTVQIKDGYVYLKKADETEFQKLSETYLSEQGITTWDDARALLGYKVGDGQIFYLGDNRKNSKDSRSEFGTCGREQVVGVVSDFAVKTKGINTFLYKIFAPVKQFLAQSK